MCPFSSLLVLPAHGSAAATARAALMSRLWTLRRMSVVDRALLNDSKRNAQKRADAPENSNLRTLARKGLGHCSANAAGSTRNHRSLASKHVYV